jgi:HEAT repeat protein
MPLDQEYRASALGYVGLKSETPDQELLAALLAIIHHPERINDTNEFASLLVDIGDERFIQPLIDKIASGVPGGDSWLADYMYALIELLSEPEDYHPVDESFAHLLGDWLLNTRGGEISWKAGDILSEVECPASKEYLLRGAADTSLFHQTRISCVRGIVNHFREDARPLLQSLEDDSSQEVREACLDAMAHVESTERRAQQAAP